MLAGLPLRQALRRLLAVLADPEPLTRERSATLAGVTAARLAVDDLEAGRDFIRRLGWMLNEESGGIGWGVPETMAETLARQPTLAAEFGSILVSYFTPGENQLELTELWLGAARAVERLARVFPELAADAGEEWERQLLRPEAEVRGLARLGLHHLGLNPAPTDDRETFKVFVGWDFCSLVIGKIDAAAAAAVRLGKI